MFLTAFLNISILTCPYLGFVETFAIWLILSYDNDEYIYIAESCYCPILRTNKKQSQWKSRTKLLSLRCRMVETKRKDGKLSSLKRVLNRFYTTAWKGKTKKKYSDILVRRCGTSRWKKKIHITQILNLDLNIFLYLDTKFIFSRRWI